jgi:glutamine synthetase type III
MSQFPVEKHTNSVIAVELAMQKWLEKHKEQTKSTVQVVYHLEIEFYLTDLFLYRSRPDLMLCGRTLQGLSPSENLFPHTPGHDGIPCRAQDFLEDVQEKAEEQGMVISFRTSKKIPTHFAVELEVKETANAPEERQRLLNILFDAEYDHDLKVLLHPQPFAGFPASAQYCNWSLITENGPLTASLRFPLQCTGTLLHFNLLATELIEKHTGTTAGNAAGAPATNAAGALAQLEASLATAAAGLHCAANKDIQAEVQAYREEQHALQLEREVHTLSQMAINHFVAAAVRHQNLLLENIRGLKKVFPEETFTDLASTQFKALEVTARYVNELRNLVHQLLDVWNGSPASKEEAPALLEEIRKRADHLEMIVDNSLWPLPKYIDLLYLE